ncbi:MAG: tRNA (adenosine(37)-N6)-dimethylallyltransferase MiaA [Bacillota bacterium]
MRVPIVAVVGPTAVGKTRVAIEVAQRVGGEIISADSMQVYRGLDIGTDKVRSEDTGGIPHHMIDICDPDEQFSVADYQQRVYSLLPEIAGRGRLPMLVGGTGLYINAVIDGYTFDTAEPDEAFRADLQRQARAEGAAGLHRRLAAVDPDRAAQIHPNDLRRIIRALERHQQRTGEAPGTTIADAARPDLDPLLFGLNGPRGWLYDRINQRVEEQLAEGLVEETKQLLARGLPPGATALQALGYKEIIPYLLGQVTLEEAAERLKRNTRRFAKRQLTWFRRDPRIRWIETGQNRKMGDAVEDITKAIADRWQLG